MKQQMAHNSCPLCGGTIIGDHTFCENCQETAAERASLDNRLELSIPKKKSKEEDYNTIENNNTSNDEPVLSLQTNSLGKKHLFLKVCIIIALLIGGGFVYLYFHNQELEEKDTAYWMQCVDQNTSMSYTNYLQEYPNGMFNVEAEEKIRELKDQEIIAWNELKTSNDINAYLSYFSEYPDTPYSYEIKNRIDALAWQAVLQENTADAYRSYIENVELGNYVGNFITQAKDKYSYESSLKILEGKEYEQILQKTMQIFDMLGKDGAKGIGDYLSENSLVIFNVRGLGKTELADSIKKIYVREYADTKEFAFDVLKNETSIVKDINSEYFITTSVVKIVVKKDKEKASRDTLNLVVKLDSSSKLQIIEKGI